MVCIARLVIAVALFGSVAAYTPLPRWGQATAIVKDVLFVHGGKTDEFNMQGYDSAPSTNDILYLSLSSSFDTSSPPWDYVGGMYNSCSTQGPSIAYHSISAFSPADLLLFGGAPSPGDPFAMRGADSASLLNIWNRETPAWTCEPQSWANEPMRRLRHSSASYGGKVYLVGGVMADGSQAGMSDHYVFDPTTPTFTRLGTTNGPPDIWGHASLMMPDGRMIVLGGYIPSSTTLNPFSIIWVLDTTQPNAGWSSPSVSTANLPTSRVGFAATILDGGKILIQGGSDSTHQTVYSDGWILDTTQNPWTWTRITELDQVGQRREHFAIAYGSSVIFGFGYGTSRPADATLVVYDTVSGKCTNSYTPPASPTFPSTIPGATATMSNGSVGSGGQGQGSQTGGGGGSATGKPNPSNSAGGNGQGGSGVTGTAVQTLTHTSSGTTWYETVTGDHGSQATGGAGNGGHNGSGNGGGSGNDSGEDQSEPSGAKQRQVMAIALGVVFGLLALVAAASVAAFYVRRRREEEHRFHGLGNDEDDFMGGIGGTEMGGAPMHGAEQAHMIGTTMGQKPGMFATIAGAVGLGALAGGAATTAARSDGHRRRDMLADEDASQFEMGYNPYYDVPRRHGSASTGGSNRSASSGQRTMPRPGLGAFMQGSLASLRSVAGAMLGAGAAGAVPKGRSREPSTKSEVWNEKDPFSDHAALIGASDGENDFRPERPRGGDRQVSSTSSKFSYHDPFADTKQGYNHNAYGHGHGYEYDATSSAYDPPTSIIMRPVMPGAVALSSQALSPVYEQSGSSNSHGTESMSLASGSVTNVSSNELGVYSSLSHDSSSRSPYHTINRPSSILDPNYGYGYVPGSVSGSTPPAAPMKRSDSWWTRFAAKSFLDRRSSVTSNTSTNLNFRDPNPAPRLGAIEEAASQSVSPTTPSPHSPPNVGGAGDGGGGRWRSGVRSASGSRRYADHRKSASSLQTTKTADTAALEQMDEYAIVMRRDNTGSSTHSRNTTASTTASVSPGDAASASAPLQRKGTAPWRSAPPPLSVVVSHGSHEAQSSESVTVHTESPVSSMQELEDPFNSSSSASNISHNQHPHNFDQVSSSNHSDSLLSFDEPLLPPPVALSAKPSTPPTPTTPRRRSPTGAIASRIAAFEQHASTAERARSPPPLAPDERNTRKIERRAAVRPTSVAYGLTPKPALFLANPDRSGTSGHSITPP